MISDDSDAGTGITQKTYADALKAGEIDSEGYAVDKESGKRTSSVPVVFKADLDRLKRDSIAYNEDLKKTQGSKFNGSGDFNGKSALDLRDYGIYDGVYGYVSAPSIDMLLPIYLGTSDSNMSYGAAHMTFTSLPIGGADTNAVIAGHTGYVGRIFFDNLRNSWERRKNRGGNNSSNSTHTHNADWDYNTRKKREEEEIDRILDKIRKNGYASLTQEEKKRLFDHSNKK